MRFGRRGTLHWYDAIIIPLALVIVYPDKVLDWIAEHTSLTSNWLHLVALEVLAGGALVTVMSLLIPHYPRLNWWYPLLFIAMAAMIRFFLWFFTRMFDLDD
jgi:hypothetical protein